MPTIESMNQNNWLCLDCGKDTLHSDDYYALRNKLWRQIVPREQRHGMLCLSCVAERLGRPLKAEDFQKASQIVDESDPDEGPMDLDDYGVIDTLTPAMLTAMDEGLIAKLASQKAERIAVLIGEFMENSPAVVPGLPDYFYLMRVELMIETGVLVVCREAEYLMHSEVRLA